jgi:hypothetical protein
MRGSILVLGGEGKMSSRTRYLAWLIGLALIDIFIPIPIVAALMIYVVARRPPWFRDVVSDLYEKA